MPHIKKFNAVDWMQAEFKKQGFVQCAFEDLVPGASIKLMLASSSKAVVGTVQSATRASVCVGGVFYSKRQVERGFKSVKVQ